MLRYRIKHIDNIGYFAQVRHNFLSGWKTIGKHLSGFGLYPDNHVEYPVDTQHDALERCRLYEQYVNHRDKPATYFYKVSGFDVKNEKKNKGRNKSPIRIAFPKDRPVYGHFC